MIYGYARVSSQKQNLELQINSLLEYGCEKIYKEKISGIELDRKQFNKLQSIFQNGDVLVVWKLDRLGRSMFELVEIISNLKNKGVKFISLTEKIDTDTPTGKIMFMFFSIMAEYELNLKKERVEAGRSLAKKYGKLGGRPKGLSKKLREKSEDIKKMYLARENNLPLYSISEIEKLLEISRPSIYKCLKFMNLKNDREQLFK